MVEQAEPQLRRDVFVALAAIGWADGALDPDEADAIVRAAVEEGLELDEIDEIEAATRERIDLGDDRSLGRSSKDDRLFVYAVACWIARLDGKVTDEESDALAGLGERLGVPERPRAHAESRSRARSPSCPRAIARRATIWPSCAHSSVERLTSGRRDARKATLVIGSQSGCTLRSAPLFRAP